MKKVISLLTSILILCAFGFSGFSANAAVVNKYGSAVENSSYKTQDSAPESSDSEEESLPSYYSSADLGYTSSVKQQYGELCWAFSSMSTYETLLLRNNLFYGDFTADNINLWGSKREDGEGWQRSLGQSGYTSIATGYFMSWNGPVTEDESTPRFGATALRFFNKNNRDEIKKAIMDKGSVNANLNTSNTGMSDDRNSLFIANDIDTIMGHSVSIVGWDDNYSKENFTGLFMPESDGAWLCKNSWGVNNTIGGYLWVSYEDYYFLNSEYFDDGYSIESFQEIKESDHLYQNEEYGATYEFKYINENSQTYFNVFDFDENGNVIDKIIFETPTVGADYSIYYVPLDSENKPEQKRAKWVKLGEGIVYYHGYICADIDDTTVSKSKAAIAVELKSNSGERCAVGVSEWLRSELTQEMIFIDTCEYGKSFVEYSKGLVDLKTFYKDELDDNIGGTFVIKAITNSTTVTDIKGDVNLDEKTDINDVTIIQQYLVNLKPELYGDQLVNADYNGDGVININDATQIQIDLV